MIKIPKKWRELSKKEKQKIPFKFFELDKKEVERIRKINDSKQKLIEAARLQYETFNDIHSYLTTWIAGYNSDVIVRHKFGSTQKLRNLFFKADFPKKINPSWADVRRRIKIPEEMNESLAEETGIHIGDGNLNIYSDKNSYKSYQYSISGNLADEYIYHEEYIKHLLKKLYGIYPTIIKRPNKNNVDSRIKSKAIVEFKNKILGLLIGNKTNIKIPNLILKNREFQKRCIVGIIDTDFSLTSSSAITGKMNNLFVIKEMGKIFTENRIPYILQIYPNYGRFHIKKEGARKIIEEWELKNQKHISKYRLLKEFKEFIPYSKTPERLAVLEGKIDIKKLKEICQKRKVSEGV